MELPDEDADVFEMFVSWLYRKTRHHDGFKIPGYDKQQECLMEDVRLFILGGKYMVEALQRTICEELVDKAASLNHRVPSLAVLDFIYANTRCNVILRKIVADWFATKDKSEWRVDGKTPDTMSTDWLYDLPEFVVDVVLALDATMEPVRNRYIPFQRAKSQYLQSLYKNTGWV